MSTFTTRVQLIGLLGWWLVVAIAAVIGTLASVGADTFYPNLERPGWAPPAAVFGPVWTMLYLLMGLAAWRVWRLCGMGGAAVPLALFIAQLVANAAWTWLFFAWHQGALAFIDVIVLWLLLVTTAASFWRIDRWAAVLLLPYLGWVSFAATLNYTLWQMNPNVLG